MFKYKLNVDSVCWFVIQDILKSQPNFFTKLTQLEIVYFSRSQIASNNLWPNNGRSAISKSEKTGKYLWGLFF